MEILLKILNLYIIIGLLYIIRPILLFRDGESIQFGLGCNKTLFSMEFFIVLSALLL